MIARRGSVIRQRLAAVLPLVFAAAMTLHHVPSAQSDGTRWVTPRTPWGDPDLQGIWPGTAMMGVPIERPKQLGDRSRLSDEEFATREKQASAQSQADREEFVAARAGRGGAGTGPPGHWGERGQPQRQSSLVVDPIDGRIPPMTAEGERRTAAVPRTWFYDNDGGGPFNEPADLSAYDRCITRGVIGSMVPVGYNAGNETCRHPDTWRCVTR